ncbi:RagB/SusD family nutrient uptake outer membrane protein [Labilibaculum euxinus]
MRKNKIYNSLFLLALFMVSMGCNDYLDKAPDERLEINSLDKVEATLVGAYQNDRGYRFTHWCTDNVTLAKNVYDNEPIIEDLYSWSRNFRNQTHQDSPSAYWVASYGSIAQVNLALEALEKLTITPEIQARVDAIKGEALVMRSYCHFMLVNLFAKHYDNSTASSDLGVPYVTNVENELIVDYERGNVKDVYDKAEKDLLDGIALLEKDSKEVNKNKYRFTYPSVYLYASRFYNYRNIDEVDVNETLRYAKKAVEAFGGVNVMRSWSEYGADEYGPIDVDQQEVGMVQESATWLIYDWVYHMTTGIRDNELSKNPFNKLDTRHFIKWIKDGDIFIPTSYFILRQGKAGNSATDIFPLAEAVFNVAEASIRLSDFEEAKKMLEIIGMNSYSLDPNPETNPRGPYNSADLTTESLKAFYKLNDDKQAWTKYLLFERRNMFLMRGFRWFDIKRYGLDVEHKLEDGTTVKLSEVAPNKDFQIPRDAINAGMEANK